MSDRFEVDVPDAELLDVGQMANFACEGMVHLDAVVPAALNRQVLSELDCYGGDGFEYWFSSSAIREVFRTPRVAGAIRSLMGPSPMYNHSFVHIVPPHHAEAQIWHADSVIDTRPDVFDVLVLYFPQDTPEEMGPTLVLPGSHLRDVRVGSIGHLRNIVGQRRLTCGAGTVVMVHADIWHCAQPNATDRKRYMFKIRLQVPAGSDQRAQFLTDGYDDPEVLERIFRCNQPWHGAEQREEQVLRAKFWRYLTGDDRVDAAHGILAQLGI